MMAHLNMRWLQDTVVALNALGSYATAAGQNVDLSVQAQHVPQRR